MVSGSYHFHFFFFNLQIKRMTDTSTSGKALGPSSSQLRRFILLTLSQSGRGQRKDIKKEEMESRGLDIMSDALL